MFKLSILSLYCVSIFAQLTAFELEMVSLHNYILPSNGTRYAVLRGYRIIAIEDATHKTPYIEHENAAAWTHREAYSRHGNNDTLSVHICN